MYLSDEPLPIRVDVVDTLSVHALRDAVVQATPPKETWNYIEQTVQRFPAENDLEVRHLHQASHMPVAEIQPHL